MQDFKKLKVWEQAHALALDVYAQTKSFPKDDEQLKQSLRGAATRIALSIAVGRAKHKPMEFVASLNAAEHAAIEVKYLLMLACDLKYFSASVYKTLDEELCGVKKMLNALAQKIEANL